MLRAPDILTRVLRPGRAAPAAALVAGLVRVTDRDTFLRLVAGRSLRQRMFGVTVRVLADGRIGARHWAGRLSEPGAGRRVFLASPGLERHTCLPTTGARALRRFSGSSSG